MSRPQVSIVMPCYQQAAYLEEAVRSVLERQDVEAELIVMDPGSTDGSRELLGHLKEEFGARLRLQFSPDAGQSDAVNRGMELARGKVLGWLNSDDRLRSGTLAGVVSVFGDDTPRWVYGRAAMIDGDGKTIASLITRYKNRRGRRFSRFKLLTENFIPQMAVFWNRPLWEQAGGLDTAKDLDMDYDLWLRFSRLAVPLVLPRDLADFRVHGAAKGSRETGAQLNAAYATARSHAAPLGLKGNAALLVHLLFRWRTRFLYLWLKP